MGLPEMRYNAHVSAPPALPAGAAAPGWRTAPATPAVAGAGFLRPGDSLWDELLKRAEFDVYQTPGYARVSAAHEGAEPVAFYAVTGDDFCLIPLLLRPVPDPGLSALGWRDATSPYGYGGILVSPNCPRSVLDELLELFRETAAQERIVTAFLRLNPLQTPGFDGDCGCGDAVVQGEVAVVDLSQSEEELWRAIRKDHRYRIGKLRRDGFTASIDDWENYDAFVRIYRETMARLNAAPYYFFDDEYFAGLRRELGGMLHLCTVFSPEGEPAGATLFTAVNGFAHYHLAGTAARFIKRAPSTLYIDSAIRWARHNGLRYLNLGGGVSARKDSLFEFKARFSRLRMPYQTIRSVLHTATYETLIAGAPGADPADDYFPAYRRKA